MDSKKEETFVVRIHDCQHSTWQGSILWAERREKKCFRSTLELISLMEEAIQLDRGDKVLKS